MLFGVPIDVVCSFLRPNEVSSMRRLGRCMRRDPATAYALRRVCYRDACHTLRRSFDGRHWYIYYVMRPLYHTRMCLVDGCNTSCMCVVDMRGLRLVLYIPKLRYCNHHLREHSFELWQLMQNP